MKFQENFSFFLKEFYRHCGITLNELLENFEKIVEKYRRDDGEIFCESQQPIIQNTSQARAKFFYGESDEK